MLVKETGLISRFRGQDILDIRKLQYDLDRNVKSYMWSKGYFQARSAEPQSSALVSNGPASCAEGVAAAIAKLRRRYLR